MKRARLVLTAVLSLSLLSGLSIDSAQATSDISIATTTFGSGIATNVGVSLAGFDATKNYQVTVKFVNSVTNVDVTNGILAATPGSTSLIAGYTSYSAAKLGFSGTYAAIAAALSSMTWNPASASGDISIRIGIASQPDVNQFYDANSGHYYKYVSAGAPWLNARTAAESTYLFGLRGYLAEINTAAENNFIGNETSATNIWIGATEDTNTAANFTGGSFNGNAGQKWIWQGAVQTPLPTGSGAGAGNTGNTTADFSSWAGGEPNNDNRPGQDCAVTNWGGAKGMWNDLGCSGSNGYLIEFGGRAGETSTATTSTLTTTVVAREAVTIGTVHANVSCTYAVNCSFPISILNPTAKNSSNVDVAGAFTYSSSNTSSATVSAVTGGASVDLVAPGSSTITATFTPTDLSLYAVGTKTFSITVTATPQATLTVSSTSGSMNGLTIISSGGSGTIAASYSVSNGTATGCSISTGVLTSSTAGTCLVTATNAANGNYASATSAQATVTLSASASTSFTSFNFTSPSVTGVVDNSAFTISLTLPNGSSTTSLVPTFVLASGATVKVGATTQTSGTTANNFSTPVTYTVTAQDGVTTQSYVVTVTLAPPAPVFALSVSSAAATAGSTFNGYTINSSGGAISSYSISPALGNGLVFDSTTGLITGTPTSAASSVTYTITATNATSSATATFELTINSGGGRRSGYVPAPTPPLEPTPAPSQEPTPVLTPTDLPKLLPITPPALLENVNSNTNSLIFSVLENNKSTAAKLSVVNSNLGLKITASDWNLSLTTSTSNGNALPVDSSKSLVANAESVVSVGGSGFLPGSPVNVYAFSKVTLLGTTVSDGSGSFNATFKLGSGVMPGKHVLQVNGFSRSKKIHSASVGLIVKPNAKSILPVANVIPFDVAKNDIGSVQKRVIASLNLPTTGSIKLIGYSSSTSTRDSDLGFSLDRALNVKSELQKLYPALTFTAVGGGTRINSRCSTFDNQCVVIKKQ